ncbi:MAG: fatty acyl-AMP ligase [Myxococcota bacterium]
MSPRFETIAQAVAEVGNLYPDLGFTFQDAKGAETAYTFPQMEGETAKRAAALQRLGLKKGDRVGLIVIEPEDFVLSFLAALRVGVVPVPLYPPMSFGNLKAYVERTARILTNAGAHVLVTSPLLFDLLQGLKAFVEPLEHVINAAELSEPGDAPDYPTITPDDLAFLQYTSGSTSDPKGVMVTHGSLIANAHAIMVHGAKIAPEAGDKGVSWLPLYHDMGLIGFVISPVYHGIPVVFIPTMRFIKQPNVWLETMHRHQATVSFAPNFAYALAARRAKASDIARWDLSRVKVLGCGAEPIQPKTMREFHETFAPAGLSNTAILPAYGMAEATLAMTFKPVDEPLRTLTISASKLAEAGEVEQIDGATAAEGEAVEHVSCGVTFPEHEIAVLDDDMRPLPDGTEGELCFRGPSVTKGYFGNPEATAKAFRDGWIRTGDLGFMLDGQTYVTGRIKDLIIVNGRNVHPQAVEWAVAEIEGVRKGNVIAFSVPGTTGEELIVTLETRAADPQALVPQVRSIVQRELSLRVSEVRCLPPGTLPKTSSGKLQRRKARDMYLRGDLGTDTRATGAHVAGSSGADKQPSA